MSTITIPKKEYKEEKDIFAPPPTRNIKEIIKEFRGTKLYSPSFLQSLEKGLRRSSYLWKLPTTQKLML